MTHPRVAGRFASGPYRGTTVRDLFHIARSAGMVLDGSDGLYAELAIEVADRIFQLAFESSLTGDAHLIDEGVALVTAYLETHATPAGIAGVPVR